MDEGGKAAPCHLLLWVSGGSKSLCDIAYDCGQCPTLHQWVAALAREGWVGTWECTACVKEAALAEKHRKRAGGVGTPLSIPGFFQSARDPSLDPEDPAYDRDRPAYVGCARCGWTNTSFLQLILRRADGSF